MAVVTDTTTNAQSKADQLAILEEHGWTGDDIDRLLATLKQRRPVVQPRRTVESVETTRQRPRPHRHHDGLTCDCRTLEHPIHHRPIGNEADVSFSKFVSLYRISGLQPPSKREWLSTLTDKGIVVDRLGNLLRVP